MTEKPSNFRKPINRREMLKKGAMAVGGAITAAAFLDGKWLKPIVKTGILPVHAQASMCGEYTFVPWFAWSEEGEAWDLSVTVLPASPTPPDGPISYMITNTNGVTILTGPMSNSGTLSSGTADFPGSYTFTEPEIDATITIKWTYTGCDYTQTYGSEVVQPPS
ncbi:MAG: hypothetical protein J7K66_04035 [Anaerolineaceae bacterium]|nr:hypothetical protein [Anaerolineaceae bacterium]